MIEKSTEMFFHRKFNPEENHGKLHLSVQD